MDEKEKDVDWPKLFAALDRVQEALQGIECLHKLEVLAMASGILIEHLLVDHLDDEGTPTKEELFKKIIKAFLRDLSETRRKAEQHSSGDREGAKKPAFDYQNFVTVPLKGVH